MSNHGGRRHAIRASPRERRTCPQTDHLRRQLRLLLGLTVLLLTSTSPAIAVHSSARLDDSSAAGSDSGGGGGGDGDGGGDGAGAIVSPPPPSVLRAVACVFDNRTQTFTATVVNPLLITLSADNGWAPPAGRTWRNGNCRFLLSAGCAVVRHFLDGCADPDPCASAACAWDGGRPAALAGCVPFPACYFAGGVCRRTRKRSPECLIRDATISAAAVSSATSPASNATVGVTSSRTLKRPRGKTSLVTGAAAKASPLPKKSPPKKIPRSPPPSRSPRAPPPRKGLKKAPPIFRWKSPPPYRRKRSPPPSAASLPLLSTGRSLPLLSVGRSLPLPLGKDTRLLPPPLEKGAPR
ncbi:hypothetical protein CLOP_g2495 [Closterium sp. NIES-67]|nr:hypothetical protein CLOP_g2495 [Closterium sp. NIES-67]